MARRKQDVMTTVAATAPPAPAQVRRRTLVVSVVVSIILSLLAGWAIGANRAGSVSVTVVCNGRTTHQNVNPGGSFGQTCGVTP
jgi:hypothetical protein